ncbi:MAG: 16S rRNA (guanine(527)-N(7))-methyltransferase RsmG [Oscillatoriophycideae cyanobacterium NC_groundwater_1537_Pr4_S-0.65um_50_18]|nr:16S rRNA (guanine(527)-N(7))-methyltransferase RsmG [Oscillatoriophycideae cyanobacterium NC_groundwater_1537_Pr4_S-0.65um_50_18]
MEAPVEPSVESSVESTPVESTPIEIPLDTALQATVEIPILPPSLETWQQTLNWQPNPTQQAQFQQLYQLILEGNRQLNLTRITHPEEFWEKHLWDSLRGVKAWLEQDKETPKDPDSIAPGSIAPEESEPSAGFKVVDIGTGAGFPGLPIAIARPDWTITLVDSTRKKMAFVESLLPTLAIANAATVTDRVEQMGHSSYYREVYDLALIRAVANGAVCAEYALPLLKLGGVAVLYRGQWTEEEAIVLAGALEKLGGELMAIEAFKTPVSESERHCLYLKKIAPTPSSLPRPVGVAAKLPL